MLKFNTSRTGPFPNTSPSKVAPCPTVGNSGSELQKEACRHGQAAAQGESLDGSALDCCNLPSIGKRFHCKERNGAEGSPNSNSSDCPAYHSDGSRGAHSIAMQNRRRGDKIDCAAEAHLLGAPAHGPVQQGLAQKPGRDWHADAVSRGGAMLDVDDAQSPLHHPACQQQDRLLILSAQACSAHTYSEPMLSNEGCAGKMHRGTLASRYAEKLAGDIL